MMKRKSIESILDDFQSSLDWRGKHFSTAYSEKGEIAGFRWDTDSSFPAEMLTDLIDEFKSNGYIIQNIETRSEGVSVWLV